MAWGGTASVALPRVATPTGATRIPASPRLRRPLQSVATATPQLARPIVATPREALPASPPNLYIVAPSSRGGTQVPPLPNKVTLVDCYYKRSYITQISGAQPGAGSRGVASPRLHMARLRPCIVLAGAKPRPATHSTS